MPREFFRAKKILNLVRLFPQLLCGPERYQGWVGVFRSHATLTPVRRKQLRCVMARRRDSGEFAPPTFTVCFSQSVSEPQREFCLRSLGAVLRTNRQRCAPKPPRVCSTVSADAVSSGEALARATKSLAKQPMENAEQQARSPVSSIRRVPFAQRVKKNSCAHNARERVADSIDQGLPYACNLQTRKCSRSARKVS